MPRGTSMPRKWSPITGLDGAPQPPQLTTEEQKRYAEIRRRQEIVGLARDLIQQFPEMSISDIFDRAELFFSTAQVRYEGDL